MDKRFLDRRCLLLLVKLCSDGLLTFTESDGPDCLIQPGPFLCWQLLALYVLESLVSIMRKDNQ